MKFSEELVAEFMSTKTELDQVIEQIASLLWAIRYPRVRCGPDGNDISWELDTYNGVDSIHTSWYDCGDNEVISFPYHYLWEDNIEEQELMAIEQHKTELEAKAKATLKTNKLRSHLRDLRNLRDLNAKHPNTAKLDQNIEKIETQLRDGI